LCQVPIAESENAAASLTLIFKSLKPPQSFTLPVQPTDTIQSIKSLLASQPRAPAADAQRLLLKGKALADAKLLKEYNIKDGDTVNLMIKPGYTWDPNVMTAPDTISNLKQEHPQIPSVVLSPSPSSIIPSSPNTKPLDINLTLDTSSIPTASSEASDTAYHATISNPAFWQELLKLLQSVLQYLFCWDIS
jgi:UV excision repair protein RAD23